MCAQKMGLKSPINYLLKDHICKISKTFTSKILTFCITVANLLFTVYIPFCKLSNNIIHCNMLIDYKEKYRLKKKIDETEL